jgi:hypothetical protein
MSTAFLTCCPWHVGELWWRRQVWEVTQATAFLNQFSSVIQKFNYCKIIKKSQGVVAVLHDTWWTKMTYAGVCGVIGSLISTGGYFFPVDTKIRRRKTFKPYKSYCLATSDFKRKITVCSNLSRISIMCLLQLRRLRLLPFIASQFWWVWWLSWWNVVAQLVKRRATGFNATHAVPVNDNMITLSW